MKNIVASAVPEPASLVLRTLGGLPLFTRRCRRNALAMVALLGIAGLLLAPSAASAEPIDRGCGLIYDPLNDITWLQYPWYFGCNNFYTQWPVVDAFSYYDECREQTLSDWRLPSPAEIESLHDVLGGGSGPFDDPMPGDWMSGVYWTNEDLAGGYATAFSWYHGESWGWDEGHCLKAWAVMNGDVPEPATLSLLTLGGLLAIRRRR